MTRISELTATDLLRHYRNKTLSPVEVAKDVLARIEDQNPTVNAFCQMDEGETLELARASEARWLKREPVGLVDGVPVTVKDIVMQKGHSNRRGSLTVDPVPMEEDAPSVARLREAGAVFVGRTTTPEFAWKGITDSPLTGITRNPWDTSKTPGGSSGGAAAAGALNLGVMHIGTDAAGSVRIPCSLSGIYGLKPTFGRVPTYPASAFVVLSHVGPQTRTVDDAALMMSVIAQPDHRDMMAQNMPAPDYRVGLERGVRGLRIAWSPRLGFVRGLDPEVEELCARAVRVFEDLGAVIEEVDPGFSDPRDVILTIWRAGAAAVLRTIPDSQYDSMDPGFVDCARAGEGLTATDFLAAFNARAALSRQMADFHERYDLLLTPTLPLVAFDAGRNTPENAAPGSEWVDWTPYTYPFNLTLQPAATVPCGLTSTGLPVGLQIAGPVRMDELVLQASKAFESACPFARIEKPRCASKQ